MSKTFEIGETVIITRTFSPDRLGVVRKITPSGLIDVEVEGHNNLLRFNLDGRLRGNDKSYYRTTYVSKANATKIEMIQKNTLIDQIKYILTIDNQDLAGVPLDEYKKFKYALDQAKLRGKIVTEFEKQQRELNPN